MSLPYVLALALAGVVSACDGPPTPVDDDAGVDAAGGEVDAPVARDDAEGGGIDAAIGADDASGVDDAIAGDAATAADAGGGADDATVSIDACAPVTCYLEGYQCGSLDDGCGGVVDCGSCGGFDTCGGGGTANRCGCTPDTCAAHGWDCGMIDDGCGGTVSCGSGCPVGDICGGADVPHTCGHTTWIDTVIDSGEMWQIGESHAQLIFDPAGNERALWVSDWYNAFVEHHPRHARLAPGATSWTVTTVANIDPVIADSLVVDAANEKTEIRYNYDASTSRPVRRIRTLPDGTVSTLTIATGDFDWFSELVLDPLGTREIAWHDRALDKVEFAYAPAGGSWAHEWIPDDYSGAGGVALASDASGVPYVVYKRFVPGCTLAGGDLCHDLALATRDAAGVWTFETIAAVFHGDTPSIAVDAAGGVHVVEKSALFGHSFHYWYRAPGATTWDQTYLGAAGGPTRTIVRVDGAGAPHVMLLANGSVAYAHPLSDGSWPVEPVNVTTASDAAMALDAAGTAHVLYTTVLETHEAARPD